MRNLEDIIQDLKREEDKEKVREIYKVFQRVGQKGGINPTGFLSLTEQYLFQKISFLFQNTLYTRLEGGISGAERKRGFISDKIELIEYLDLNKYFAGINLISYEKINSNFILEFLKEKGISLDKIGDIWLTHDGWKIIFANEIRDDIEEVFNDTNFEFKILSFYELQSYTKPSKILRTTEASKRVDAIGSFALGISRSKMQTYIKGGGVEVNGRKIQDSFYELNIGDIVTVHNLGSFRVLDIKVTSRGKFHIEIERMIKK